MAEALSFFLPLFSPATGKAARGKNSERTRCFSFSTDGSSLHLLLLRGEMQASSTSTALKSGMTHVFLLLDNLSLTSHRCTQVRESNFLIVKTREDPVEGTHA
jgi:hypothetical protein